MIISFPLILLPIACSIAFSAAVPSSPYMLFKSPEIPAIRQRMKSEPYKSVYDALDKRSALRWVVDSDTSIIREIKAWAYNGLITARANMKPGNTFNWSPFQWGRRVQEWTIPMDMVIASAYFTDPERKALRLACDSIAYRLRDPGYIESGLQNRTLDQVMGVAFAGVFMFPDNPNAADHLNYVQKEVERHLKFVQEDGTWPETSRYVGLVVLKCFALYSRVLRNYNGTDLTKDPRYRSMFGRFMEIMTPRDVLNENAAVAPGIGDAGWISGEYATLCYGAAELATCDPGLSKALHTLWHRAGKPWLTPNNQLLYVDLNAPPDPSVTLGNVFQKISGYFIFRHYFDTPEERYLIAKKAKINQYHRHNDAGSFSLYAFNTPLMLDPGICDYSSPELDGFKETRRHNVVAFKEDLLFVNGAHSGTLLDTVLSPGLDLVKFDLGNASAEYYHRTIATVKSGCDVYVVYDCIGGKNPSENNFHILSTSTTTSISDGIAKSVSECYNHMKTEILYLLPAHAAIGKSKSKMGECPESWPRNLADQNDTNDRKNVYQEWLSVRNSAGGDYLTVINPVKTGTEACEAKRRTVSNSHGTCFRVSTAGGTFMVVANDTLTAQAIAVPSDSPLVDLATETVYNPQNHFVKVTVAPTGIIVLADKNGQSAIRKEIGTVCRKHLAITVRNREVFVSIPRIPDGRGELSIARVSGKIIHTVQVTADAGHLSGIHTTGGLPAGVYLVRYRQRSMVLCRSIAIY